ncbi:MAG: hypothetical protein WBW88_07165 [Rhodothermales bacterium]
MIRPHIPPFPVLLFAIALFSNPAVAQERFTDDFSGDLSGWELVGGHAISIVESGDPDHGPVLALQPDGIVYALIKDSDNWGPVRIEGSMLFPGRANAYLGVMYNYTRHGERADFGEIYVKGNGSYLRMNPWRDGNVSRLLYEEYRTPITGDDAIKPDAWQRFKVEIEGSMCHFYVGDMSVPKVTFGLYEGSSGMIGIKPRVVGDPVWVDDIRVTSIDALAYDGPGIPAIAYEPDSLITDWEVIGPFGRPMPEIEWNNEAHSWRPFETDARGAVITGKVTEYSGEHPVAYFRTTIASDREREVTLHFSTVDELGIWVNDRFDGFLYRDGYVSLPENDWNAWYDFWKNPDHVGSKARVHLKVGQNRIVIRVRNGQFASGGFFVRMEGAD